MSDKSINHALVNLVEGVPVRIWRDQNGARLKDTGEWVDFYLSTKDNTRSDVWISVDGYKNMPDGKWLARFEDGEVEVMKVGRNKQGHVIASSGNQFAFDLPKVTGYMKLPETK